MMRLKNSSGYGLIHILIVVAGLVILGIGGYMFYQSTFNKSDSNISVQQREEIESNCKLAGEDEMVCAALAGVESVNLEPVTYTLTSHATDGIASTMTVKSSGDNYHAVMKNGPDTDESIRVDGVNYHTFEGVWYFQKDTPGNEHGKHHTNFASSDYMSELVTSVSGEGVKYENVGQEPCGEIMCTKYKLESRSEPGLIDYLWIDPQTNRFMKYESKPATGAVTKISYAYGPVEIKAPANAKDYAELSSN